MKSISHPQVTVLEIKPVFRSLHYTIQFDGCFFFFFATAITIFFFLPFVPFLNCRSEQNDVPKAIEKSVARYEPENLRLLHLFQVFKPKKTEFRDRKIVLNTDRYLSIEQSLKWSTISRERASVYSTQIAKTGSFFTHNLLRSIDADFKALFHFLVIFFTISFHFSSRIRNHVLSFSNFQFLWNMSLRSN